MTDPITTDASVSVLEQLRRPTNLEPIERNPDLHQAFLEDVAAAMQAAGVAFCVMPHGSPLLLDTRLGLADASTGVRLSFIHGTQGFLSGFRVHFYDMSTDREIHRIELMPGDDAHAWYFKSVDFTKGCRHLTLPEFLQTCGSAADTRAILASLIRWFAKLPGDPEVDASYFADPALVDPGASAHAPRYDQL